VIFGEVIILTVLSGSEFEANQYIQGRSREIAGIDAIPFHSVDRTLFVQGRVIYDTMNRTQNAFLFLLSFPTFRSSLGL